MFENNKFYTVKEVATIFRTSEITIRHYIYKKKLNTTYVGNKYLISGQSLNNFVTNGGMF